MPSCPTAGRKGATAPHRQQRGQRPVPNAGVLLIADQIVAKPKRRDAGLRCMVPGWFHGILAVESEALVARVLTALRTS